MTSIICHSPLFIRYLALLTFTTCFLHADPAFVDLRTVMRLAGANNDEIQLARARHDEAVAESKKT